MQDTITVEVNGQSPIVLRKGEQLHYQWRDCDTYELKRERYSWDYVCYLCRVFGNGISVKLNIDHNGNISPSSRNERRDMGAINPDVINGFVRREYEQRVMTVGSFWDTSYPSTKGWNMFNKGDRVRIKSGYNLEGGVFYYVGKNEQDATKVVVVEELCDVNDMYAKLDVLTEAIEAYPYSTDEKVELFIEDLESILDCDKCVMCDEVRNGIAALLTADGVSLNYKPVVAAE